MSCRYAITQKEGNFERVLYESASRARIYAWLKDCSVLDAPGYTVIDRATSVTWEEGEFIREFERESNAQRRAKLKDVSYKPIPYDHFAVVYRVDLKKPPVFEGTEEAVHEWITNVGEHSIWWIRDVTHGDHETPEEFVNRVGHKYKQKPQLTEEDVRRIVDQRVREVLETVAKDAEDRSSGLAAYETQEIMRPAFAAVYTLLENITDRLAENDREKGQGG